MPSSNHRVSFKANITGDALHNSLLGSGSVPIS